MSSPSIETETFSDWYRLAAEFLKACDDGATTEEVEAGHKALALAWFGLKSDPMPHETHRAMLIFDMAGRRLLRAELNA